MFLPFKCIVDVANFRENLESVVGVDNLLLEEDGIGDYEENSGKLSETFTTKNAANWRNASFGIILSQKIEKSSVSEVIFSQMMWDWNQVNRENLWFREIHDKYDCGQLPRKMDGRSFCLTPVQRFNAMYENFVRSLMPPTVDG